uniref:Uncharacterized protein n=1 Tax=Meloidogyne enterolobii TaxID=390850 RepID=A0A6V7TS99_MELEN|nr:unnamed protein product [Meloidogyne enterolobii]
MIRSRLEKLARVKKRQRLEDSSINQTSSSHQGNLENNEHQVNISSESILLRLERTFGTKCLPI